MTAAAVLAAAMLLAAGCVTPTVPGPVDCGSVLIARSQAMASGIDMPDTYHCLERAQ